MRGESRDDDRRRRRGGRTDGRTDGRGGQGERIEQRETNKCASNARYAEANNPGGRGRCERLAIPLVVFELVVCHSHRRFGFVLREDGKVVIGEGDGWFWRKPRA